LIKAWINQPKQQAIPVESTISVMGAWYESRRGQNVVLFSGGNNEVSSDQVLYFPCELWRYGGSRSSKIAVAAGAVKRRWQQAAV
jgi:hypothetical protein